MHVPPLPHLTAADPEIAALVEAEQRQHDKLRLIPTENYASRAVLEATGSVLTNKYSEGYAGKRYYEGQQHVDAVEELAIDAAPRRSSAPSTSTCSRTRAARQPRRLPRLLQAGRDDHGPRPAAGGHLTHGWNGQHHRQVLQERCPTACAATTTASTSTRCAISPGRAAQAAHLRRHRVSRAPSTSPAFADDRRRGRRHPRRRHRPHRRPRRRRRAPVAGRHRRRRHHDHAQDAARPARRDALGKPEHAPAIDHAVFPGLQGGPHNHTTAGIAVARTRRRSPSFRTTPTRSSRTPRPSAPALVARGFGLVTGGTDNHLLLIDLTPKDVAGKPAAQALDAGRHRANYNSIPFDPRKPFDPSGLRLGTPAVTSRGMGEERCGRSPRGWTRPWPRGQGRRGRARPHRGRGRRPARRLPDARLGAPTPEPVVSPYVGVRRLPCGRPHRPLVRPANRVPPSAAAVSASRVSDRSARTQPPPDARGGHASGCGRLFLRAAG